MGTRCTAQVSMGLIQFEALWFKMGQFSIILELQLIQSSSLLEI